MIKVIYGAKGTGKTKMMIDAANETVKIAKGHMIFITDSKRGMYDLEREIRFIDTSEYDIAGEAALCGFVKGVIAGKPVQEMAAFFYMLDKVSKDSGVTITVSVSANKEDLPDFVTKYL